MRAKRIPQTGSAFRSSGSTTLNQNRTHNVANEITNITETTGTAWPTPTHDANGNSTKVPRPLSLGNSFDLKYDAWNRLVEVKNTGGAVVATYRYDGANRRVTFYDGTNTRHYYYSDQWQVLEERLNSASTYDQRYVFGLRYIDDLILRDDGGTRHYCLSDYFSITSIVNTSGTVLERYTYDAFGAPTYLTGAWGARGSSSYGWETLYASYRYDIPIGLYQVRNRYLHPNLGRWITRDPIDYEDGVNLYAYVRNNAVNRVDFWGLRSFPYGAGRFCTDKNCKKDKCASYKNLPEDEWDSWKDAPEPGKCVDSDAVGEVSGRVIKIPDNCACFIKCDEEGKPTHLDCYCRGYLIPGIPDSVTVNPPGFPEAPSPPKTESP